MGGLTSDVNRCQAVQGEQVPSGGERELRDNATNFAAQEMTNLRALNNSF
jgi:hypothetical protein